MAGNDCTCGEHFMDPEDWRDHMPCPGTPYEQEKAKREALERELASYREREAERLKKRGNYWLTPEGRAELRESFGPFDPTDSNAVIPLLDALEDAETRLKLLRDQLNDLEDA